MSNNNNNKQQLDPESLLVFDKAQAPSTTTVNVGDVDLGFPEINQVAAAPQNLVQSAEAHTTTPTVNKLDHDGISLVERRSSDVKPWEKNDSLGFLLDCAKKGENLGKQRPPSICKVSRILRDLSESSFHPQLVSIGPIHREDPKLQEFERHKACYLNDLLNRCYDSTPKKTLEACLQKVNDLMPQIRESYAGVIKNYSDVELARMMVMDGCFILEFCFKHEEEDLYLPNKMQNTRIAMDLMLLENQVPFLVLQALFNCSIGKLVSVTLSEVLDKYLAPYIKLFHSLLPEKKKSSNILDNYLTPYIKRFRSLLLEKKSTTDVDSDSITVVDSDLPEKISITVDDSDLPEKISTTDVDSDSNHDHVLGYMHKRYQLLVAKSSNPKHAEESKLVDEEQKENTHTAIHSIVELDRSGINFKPHKEDNWSMTIKFHSPLFRCLPWFWSKPTVLMPTLVIDDITELILRNFIAYEQSFPQDQRYHFTSYAHAMDMLIDTQEDIAKLAESKVLLNVLGSNQEAADMINKIGRNISVTYFDYAEEFKEMDKYHNHLWPKYIAWLRKVYFSNPWSIIALLAAFILFGLTVTQTIFTIKAA